MKKLFKSIIFTLILTLCVTGCGSITKEESCESSAESIALNYLRTNYNIDASIISTNVKMKNQTTFWDGTYIGGEPSGEADVYADYNGKTIEVNVNCYDNTVSGDNLHSDLSITDYSNCYIYDGIYFCDKVSKNIIPDIKVSNSSSDISISYEIERNNYKKLVSSFYYLEHTIERGNSYLVVFIPAYKIDTTIIDNNRLVCNNYLETAGRFELENIDLHLTKDEQYYVGYYNFTPGKVNTTCTIIK